MQESEVQPPGIFQTGIDTIIDEIDKEIHRVKLRPEVMRKLILHMARSREQPGLVEKVENYLQNNPLEINLSSQEVLSIDETGVVLGSFRVPECNSSTSWPVISLPQFVVGRLYQADLAIRRPDLSPNLEHMQQALNVNQLFFLPHEIEHFINYVDHPEWLRFLCQELPERKSYAPGAAAGLMGGLYILASHIFSQERMTRRDLLKRFAVGLAVGLRFGAGTAQLVERWPRLDAHDDTPHIYQGLTNRLGGNDAEFLILTAASFDFTEILSFPS